MTGNRHFSRGRARRGSAMIEFALVTFLLCLVLLAAIELDRMVLVYTTMCNAARSGVRYAIVHGGTRSGGLGTSVDAPSGLTNHTQVDTMVRNFTGTGALSTGSVTVSVAYDADPGTTVGCSAPDYNTPGCRVTVTVSYPYDPLITLLPLRVTLRSINARGVITF